jgi:hypothetical protein
MDSTKLWSYCSPCGQNTKHSILFNKTIAEYVTDEHYHIGNFIYQVVECNGCEQLSFRREYHDHTDIYQEGEELTCRKYTDIYPSSLINHKPLDHTYHIPEKIRYVYDQTILALKGESRLLAGVGFRAIIEAICQHEKIKGSNLESKINGLAKNRLLTDKESERLHPIRFLGNDAVHEMEAPSDEKLLLVLHIIEHLLESLYILDNNAKDVLDTIIRDYPDFEKLFFNCTGKCQEGEIKTLIEILNKNIRRISPENLKQLEALLIDNINNKLVSNVIIVENTQGAFCADARYRIISTIDVNLPF